MKKIIVAVIIMILIPFSFAGAEDKGTVDPAKVMPSKGYLSVPAMQAYHIFKERMAKETDKANFVDCIKGEKRILNYGRMDAGNEEPNPNQEYHSNVWVTIQCGR
jgi:hypothetical protein